MARGTTGADALAVWTPPDPAVSNRSLPRRIGVEPLADIVAPAEGLVTTTGRRIGVEAFELFEPASPRDEMFCAAGPHWVTGIGPDAADSTPAPTHHAAARHSALT